MNWISIDYENLCQVMKDLESTLPEVEKLVSEGKFMDLLSKKDLCLEFEAKLNRY